MSEQTEGVGEDLHRHITEAVEVVENPRYFSISVDNTSSEQRAEMIRLVQSFDENFSVYLENPIGGEVEVDVMIEDE